MDDLTLHSGLADFRLIDRINKVTPHGLSGEKKLVSTPAWCALEAMAQLAALHVRYLKDFSCHAFLMKVTRMRLPADQRLDGIMSLEACLGHQSDRTAAYRVQARIAEADPLGGEILISTRDYDDTFKHAQLETHYRKLFACLLNATTESFDVSAKPVSFASPRK